MDGHCGVNHQGLEISIVHVLNFKQAVAKEKR